MSKQIGDIVRGRRSYSSGSFVYIGEIRCEALHTDHREETIWEVEVLEVEEGDQHEVGKHLEAPDFDLVTVDESVVARDEDE